MATTREQATRERAAHLGPERRRPLVLDAALRVFVKHGYTGASMEEIAAAAGVTKPVVYDCFAGKEELFRALLDREEKRLLEGIAEALPSQPDFGDIEGLMGDGFTALLQTATAMPDSWRVVFDAQHGAEPVIARRVWRAKQAIVDELGRLVEPALLAMGVEDAQRKAPVMAELLAAIGETGVRILLDRGAEWTPQELGGLLARVTARGPAAA